MTEPEVVREFTHQAEAFAASPAMRSQEALGRLVELLPARAGERWLDAACGPGLVARALAPRVGEVVGVDVTPAMVELARLEAEREGLGNAVFSRGDVTALAFPGASFDGAVTRFSLHHVPLPGRVVAELARVVRPGGAVVVADHVTSEDGEQAAWHQELERLRDPSTGRASPARGCGGSAKSAACGSSRSAGGRSSSTTRSGSSVGAAARRIASSSRGRWLRVRTSRTSSTCAAAAFACVTRSSSGSARPFKELLAGCCSTLDRARADGAGRRRSGRLADIRRDAYGGGMDGAVVLVDAENVRRSRWPNVAPERLVELCRAWAEARGLRAVVVFDGTAPGSLLGAHELDGCVAVVGTGGESADDWLVRAAASHRERGERFWLVTSDRALRAAASPGAERVVGGGSFVRELLARDS